MPSMLNKHMTKNMLTLQAPEKRPLREANGFFQSFIPWKHRFHAPIERDQP
jgi:hypothetical protein